MGYAKDVEVGTMVVPEMEDLYEDMCDGACVCALVAFYKPEEMHMQGTNLRIILPAVNVKLSSRREQIQRSLLDRCSFVTLQQLCYLRLFLWVITTAQHFAESIFVHSDSFITTISS